MKRTTIAAVVVLAGGSAAWANVLWNNGPYITHPNAPHTTLGTANVSQLQNTTLGHSTLGFTVSPGYRLTDDFTVPSGQQWTVSSVNVFAYSTNFATAPSGANLRLWRGDPSSGGVLVHDGSGGSTLLSATFEALRIAETTNPAPPFSDTARRVFNLEIGVPNVVLSPGQYWVDWQVNPTAGASFVYNPPVTIPGQAVTAAGGAARQWNGSVWGSPLAHANTNGVDLPFVVNGVPAPGGIAVLGISGLLAARRRRS